MSKRGIVVRGLVISGVFVLAVLGLAVPTAFGPARADATVAHPATVTKTVSRTFLDAGATTVVDKRTVTLHVAQTTNLKSLQLVNVTWSGARPTAGLVADRNSDLAQNEEYSFALFECRGVDSVAHPLSPGTCWTQFADERFDYGSADSPYPAWRSDLLAPPAERGAFVNAPSALTTSCHDTLIDTTYQRWVPFVGADGTNYPGGPAGCQGLPAEASPANLSSNVSLPSNETYGVTDSKGNGSALFDIFTAGDHASLGCSITVACSLVALPIMGISCDPEGAKLPAVDRPDAADAVVAKANCERTGVYPAGGPSTQGFPGDPAVSGKLWWAPSNWANRMSVPLTFAPADNVCSLQSSATPTSVYGSELLIQTTTQWAPAFCLNRSLFDLNHVQTPEPQARSLLATSNVDAIYTSYPGDTPYPYPTVHAPVAVTGFGIAYAADDVNGAPVGRLNLDARLLAKLLTESYPADVAVKTSYRALADNPLSITNDPEFIALNPGIPARATDAAATLLTLNTDSDVIQALTSYINADPEARAWLNGKPDPWGMVVNPNYADITLPVNNWPLLDSFEPLSIYKPGLNDCLASAPSPWLPLVAAPQARLFTIGQDLQFAIAQSQTTCFLPTGNPGDPSGAKLVAAGRQPAGHRFMLGTVSMGDAAREGLSLASLQTHNTSVAGTQFTAGTGRTFVAPTQTSLRAAVPALHYDPTKRTWTLPYGTLQSSSSLAGAYPGTMIVYAAIPTSHINRTDAINFGKLLTFAAGPGQTPGTGQGQLPPGFLPMTAANGLGRLADFTARAAAAVAAQHGDLPPLVAPPVRPAPKTSAVAPTRPTPVTTTTTSRQVATTSAARIVVPSRPSTSPAAKTSPTSAKSSSSSPPPVSVGAQPVSFKTPRYDSSLAGAALPVLLALALVAGAVALAVRLRASGRRVL